MQNIKTAAATSALNEDKYINELYDTGLKKQQDTLKGSYEKDSAALDSSQKTTRQQTDAYVNRTEVESQKADSLYGDGRLSQGAQGQIGLARENARRKNVTQLETAQGAADAEYQRQRQLKAREYEAAIRQAQADNDMARAQALYDAAKAEEAQLLQLQKEGAALMQSREDTTVLDQIAQGVTLPRDTQADTWEGVLDNEKDINAIYDAQLKQQLEQLDLEHTKAMSDLEAQRQQQETATDEKLTQAYVEGLLGQKNRGEMQAAYGRGTGTGAQERLAGDIRIQEELTDLRKLQLDRNAKAGLEGAALDADRSRKEYEALSENEKARIRALYDAAEEEEQILIGNQQFVGQQMAGDDDYEMLGLLYGLTADQIDMLMGRGKYAPSGGDDGGGRGPERPVSTNKGAEATYREHFNGDDEKAIKAAMKARG